VEKLQMAVEKTRVPVETLGNTWGKLARKIRIAKSVISPDYLSFVRASDE
jgi:hypothetical protein